MLPSKTLLSILESDSANVYIKMTKSLVAPLQSCLDMTKGTVSPKCRYSNA